MQIQEKDVSWRLLSSECAAGSLTGHQFIVEGQRLFIVGGYVQGRVLSEVWLYNLALAQFTQLPSLKQPIHWHVMHHDAADKVAYIVGGEYKVWGGKSLKECQIFDIND